MCSKFESARKTVTSYTKNECLNIDTRANKSLVSFLLALLHIWEKSWNLKHETILKLTGFLNPKFIEEP